MCLTGSDSRIASPTFYSLGNARTPVTVSMVSVGVNLALNLILIEILGYRGLALGTAIAALFNAGALLFLLHRRLNGLDSLALLHAAAKIVAASAVMGLVATIASGWLAEVLPVSEAAGTAPVLLLDDALSELDPGVRESVLREIQGADSQVFLTSPEPLAVSGAARWIIDGGGIAAA